MGCRWRWGKAGRSGRRGRGTTAGPPVSHGHDTLSLRERQSERASERERERERERESERERERDLESVGGREGGRRRENRVVNVRLCRHIACTQSHAHKSTRSNLRPLYPQPPDACERLGDGFCTHAHKARSYLRPLHPEPDPLFLSTYTLLARPRPSFVLFFARSVAGTWARLTSAAAAAAAAAAISSSIPARSACRVDG
jgi:hypothetical protein